jgi:hypothetical protein
MSSAYSTSGGGGATAGHPEHGLASARSSEYLENERLRLLFEAAHPEIEIVPPSPEDHVSSWGARYRSIGKASTERKHLIYQSDDLGMLLRYLKRLLEPEKM